MVVIDRYINCNHARLTTAVTDRALSNKLKLQRLLTPSLRKTTYLKAKDSTCLSLKSVGLSDCIVILLILVYKPRSGVDVASVNN